MGFFESSEKLTKLEKKVRDLCSNFCCSVNKCNLDGITLKSPNGTCYLLSVADDGTVTTTLTNCPS